MGVTGLGEEGGPDLMEEGGCSEDAAPADVAERVICQPAPPDMAHCGAEAAEIASGDRTDEIGAVSREFGVLDMPSWACPRIPYAVVGGSGSGGGQLCPPGSGGGPGGSCGGGSGSTSPGAVAGAGGGVGGGCGR
jgi:hypothetical protein